MMKTKYIYSTLQLLLLFGLISFKVIGQNTAGNGPGMSSPQVIMTVSTCTYDFPSQLNYIAQGETKAVSLGGGGTMTVPVPTTEDQGQVIDLEDGDKKNGSKSKNEETPGTVDDSGVMRAIPSGCMPVVSDDRTWITTSYNSTLQDLFITVSSNSGAPRTGTVDVDGHEIIISQAGVPPATPGAISGDAASCYDEIETYSISPVANATGYTWVVPSGATINSGQNTTQINVTFGMTPGNVQVKANNSVGSSDYQSKYVSLVSHPYVYDMTGGGNYCEGTQGVPVGLSYSQTGVNYQLTKDNVSTGSPVAGTGSALNFGTQTTGIYRVIATNPTGCSRTMDGTAVPIPVGLPIAYTVEGGGSYCSGGSGIEIKLSDSQPGVTYQLKLDGVNTGSPKSGTGSEISFGYKTAAGTYTVVATSSNDCTNTMTGSVAISVNPLPTAYTVTGGGSYCSGGSGVPVGLSDTQTGVTYQLKLNGSTNIGSPITGTGGAISFGNKTTVGAYTVVATNSSTGCTKTMTGSATVTVNALPTTYSVTGGGSYCSGGTGVSVGLSGSQTGVNYQLKLNGGTNIGSPIAGTGNAISFGNKTTVGAYTVVATNSSTGCTKTMTGSATVTVNALPTTYSVTGGGSYCSGGSGVNVGLSGSQTGVNYQLKLNGSTNIGSPVTGTGSAISFGNKTTVGAYTVVATNSSTGCTKTMTGSATVTVNALPTTYSVTGGGSYCSGGTGVSVGLSGSQTGVNYQLKLNGGTNIGSPVTGTGSAISFGNKTTVGTYTVVATNSSTGCTKTMTGSATVTVNALPITYSVTGGGSYCSGGSGVSVGLSDSQTGVDYQLKLNGSTNIGSPVPGTGSAISFGNQTLAGNYTVVATNPSGCTNTMTSSATITINSLPAAYTVTGGGSYCSGGSGVEVGLSDSQTGVDYQLKLNGSTNIGSPVPGTGSAISFGNKTLAGNYTVVATNSSGCTNTMTSSATITINSLPTAYTVTGGGSYCSGDEVSGFNIGLNGSQAGVSYQLKLNGSTDVGSAIAGTDTAISFGNHTSVGTYTVVATNSSTGCTSTMPGSVPIIENQIPGMPVSIVNGTVNGVDAVYLSAQPGENGTGVKWYTSSGDYLTTGTTYSPILSQSTKYNVTTYNSATGCESAGKAVVTATVNGIFQYKFDDARSNTKNYLRKVVFKTPVKSLADIIYLDEEEVYEELSYVDGLGRTLQTHSMGATGAGESVVQIFSYDSLGRQDAAYLPFVHETKGFYLDETRNIQEEFYKNLYDDDSAFSTVKYETSPLSRVLEAGAVGENWQLSTGNTVKYDYKTNTGTDAVIQWIYNSANNNYTGTSNYASNKLFKNTVTDQDGKSVTTFTDRDGKTILKDQEGLQTYYIYDLYGRLVHILPPEFVDTLAEVNNIVDTSYNLVKKYCYTYIYGERSLLVEKHLPGIEPIEYVYDKFKRPVMSRNGNLRSNNQWSFVKFDRMGRTIQSGIWTDNGTTKKTRSQLQVLLFNESDIYETYVDSTGEYSDNVTPTSGEIHIENFYDVYHPDAVAFDNNLIIDETYTTNTLGFLTFTKVKILDGSNSYLTTTIYYNEKGQQIQVLKDNIFGKTDISATKYNFMGQIEELKVEHTMPDDQIEAVTKYYTYDGAGRLASVEQEIEADSINGKVKMLEMEYNKLGQVTAKKLHETATPGEFLQNIDYKYNIHGWLTAVNDPDSLSEYNDLFGFRLHYNDQIDQNGTMSEGLNSGLITAMEWNVLGANPQKRAYSYSYDDHYRLDTAHYSEDGNIDAVGRYDVNLTYTANGKINTLKREGKRDDGKYGLIDDLTYGYNGNKLLRVVDLVNKDSIATDIKHFPDDLNAKSEEYSYDSNGNMVSDANKKLDSISYNHLNLPELVYFDENNYIEYTYDAAGNKLKKLVIKPNTKDSIIFVGSFIYENSNLAQIQTEEGRVTLEGTTYDYEYFLKDHLGNVRVTFHEDATTAGEAELIQENHYYPFGMRISGIGSWTGSNNKLYNGKELSTEAYEGIDLSWYDYGARNYDPQLGTWFNVDPMAEMYTSHSPYNYCLNNPVNYIDPNGMYVSKMFGGHPEGFYNGDSDVGDINGGGGGRWNLGNRTDLMNEFSDWSENNRGKGSKNFLDWKNGVNELQQAVNKDGIRLPTTTNISLLESSLNYVNSLAKSGHKGSINIYQEGGLDLTFNLGNNDYLMAWDGAPTTVGLAQSSGIPNTGDKFYSENGTLIWNTNMEGDPNRVYVIPDNKMKVYRANLAMSKNWNNGANQLRLDTRAMSTEVNFYYDNGLYVYPKFWDRGILHILQAFGEGFAAGYTKGYYTNKGLESDSPTYGTESYWEDYYTPKKFEPWW